MADPMEEAKHEAEADVEDERLNKFMESLGCWHNGVVANGLPARPLRPATVVRRT